MNTANSGRIRPYSATLIELNRAADAAIICIGLWLATQWTNRPWEASYVVIAVFASLVFAVAGSFSKLYRSWRSDHIYMEASRILLGWTFAIILTGFILFLIDPHAFFPRKLAWWWFITTATILISTRACIRLGLHLLRIRGHNYQKTAIVGSTLIAVQIAEAINAAPWMGLKFVGFFDDRLPKNKRVLDALQDHIQGTVSELIEQAKAGDIDRAYIALPLRAETRIKELIDRLSETPASVLFVPDFFVFNMLHANWEHIGHLHVVNVVTSPFLGVAGVTKRVEDIVLSSVILTVIAIPLVIIGIGIKLGSPGPIIFQQRRYGLNGKEFYIWKFRTMTVCEDGAKAVQATAGDPRVTPFGRFLRRTSLDELPQFINVLQGRMSIVGPRPHPLALDNKHKKLIPRYVLRHKIRPGISGWAQVNGFRGETDTLEKMEKRILYDLEYIDRWSLLLDIKIIWLTIFRGFTDKNAV